LDNTPAANSEVVANVTAQEKASFFKIQQQAALLQLIAANEPAIDVNLTNSQGYNLFTLALDGTANGTNHCHYLAVALLISYGADPYQTYKDNNGKDRQPIDIVGDKGDVGLVKLLYNWKKFQAELTKVSDWSIINIANSYKNLQRGYSSDDSINNNNFQPVSKFRIQIMDYRQKVRHHLAHEIQKHRLSISSIAAIDSSEQSFTLSSNSIGKKLSPLEQAEIHLKWREFVTLEKVLQEALWQGHDDALFKYLHSSLFRTTDGKKRYFNPEKIVAILRDFVTSYSYGIHRENQELSKALIELNAAHQEVEKNYRIRIEDMSSQMKDLDTKVQQSNENALQREQKLQVEQQKLRAEQQKLQAEQQKFQTEQQKLQAEQQKFQTEQQRRDEQLQAEQQKFQTEQQRRDKQLRAEMQEERVKLQQQVNLLMEMVMRQQQPNVAFVTTPAPVSTAEPVNNQPPAALSSSSSSAVSFFAPTAATTSALTPPTARATEALIDPQTSAAATSVNTGGLLHG
jgi:hypothetical protein